MVYWFELKKLLQSPAIIGFLLLCLALNVVIVFSSYKGSIYNMDTNTAGMEDIFDEYTTKSLSEHYIKKLGVTGGYAENIRRKYELLQITVDEKGKSNVSLSPYFGTQTRYMHQLLFQRLLGVLTLESCLAALFAALLSTGYECSQNTESIVYASKLGRKLQQRKFLASLAMATGCFFCLFGITLLFYFLRFDYGYVWNDSVSSLFNSSLSDYSKPFITWLNFTVLELLLAYCAISAGLAVCFSWLGFTIGTFARNSFHAAGLSVGISILLLVIEPLLPYGSQIRTLSNIIPIRLIINIGDWFTDGYASIIWPDFECLGILLSLITLGAAVMIAMARLAGRDII